MQPQLTNNDIIGAAKTIGCEVAVIRAIDDVETGGMGFTSAGKIVLRFETAKFKSYTGLTVTGSDQAAFDRAYALNPHYALMATSWGRFQIMGFNYDWLGYGSVEAFVAALKQSEQNQLAAFVQFIIKSGLGPKLIKKDFPGIASVYNGKYYKDYATKLAASYAKFQNQPLPATNDVLKKKRTLPRS